MPTRILHVVGARPNFMKIAPIMREMAKHPGEFEQILVHTGQHYDDNMSQLFFEHLALPRPDVNLEVGSGTHAWQTAQVMLRFEPVVANYKPGWVIVVGDVNSTLACALVCSKLGVKVAHVEAGLRSHDRTMPEEINRLLTDHISDLLFTPSHNASENLLREGIAPEKICFVGNVMIDTLVELLPLTESRPILQDLGLADPARLEGVDGSRSRGYVVVTLHRPANVDHPGALKEIVAALVDISETVPVIFPVHPRTRRRIAALGLDKGPRVLCAYLHMIDPIGYLDFLALMRYAALVITDSGGVQEETTYLGVPCLTVRPNTERPITITHGTNRLVSHERHVLSAAAISILRGGPEPGGFERPELWDGCAASRIVAMLRKIA